MNDRAEVSLAEGQVRRRPGIYFQLCAQVTYEMQIFGASGLPASAVLCIRPGQSTGV